MKNKKLIRIVLLCFIILIPIFKILNFNPLFYVIPFYLLTILMRPKKVAFYTPDFIIVPGLIISTIVFYQNNTILALSILGLSLFIFFCWLLYIVYRRMQGDDPFK